MPYLNEKHPAHDSLGTGSIPLPPPARYDDVAPTYDQYDPAGPTYDCDQNNIYAPRGNVVQSADYPANAVSRISSTSEGGRSGSSEGLSAILRNMAPTGKSIASLLDPPPQQFLRAPRTNLSYGPFEPAALISSDSELDKGFPPLAPPVTTVPHPFATHDIAEDDWQRFLHDVKAASSLSTIDKIKVGVAPMAMGVAPLTGFLISKGIEKRMRTKKSNAIGELIEHWNAHFFHPRRISVVLAQGAMSYSGPEGVPPPDMEQYTAATARDNEAGWSSSEEEVHQGRTGGRRERLGALREREADRRQHADRRRVKRKNRQEMWRLVIVYKPGRG